MMSDINRKQSAQTVFDKLPKNFSYEENYHQKYYYPRLILERIRQRYGSKSRRPSGGGLSLSDSLPSLEQIASCCIEPDDVTTDLMNETWERILCQDRSQIGYSGMRRMSGSEDHVQTHHRHHRSGIAPYIGEKSASSDGGSSSLGSSSSQGNLALVLV